MSEDKNSQDDVMDLGSQDIVIPIPQKRSVALDRCFDLSSWTAMCSDYKLQFPSDYAISQVKPKKKTSAAKAPHIYVVIKSIHFLYGDASVVLKDPTGEVSGCIEKSFVATYRNKLSSGTALALNNVTVLRSKLSYFVVITGSNVLRIYPADVVMPDETYVEPSWQPVFKDRVQADNALFY